MLYVYPKSLHGAECEICPPHIIPKDMQVNIWFVFCDFPKRKSKKIRACSLIIRVPIASIAITYNTIYIIIYYCCNHVSVTGTYIVATFCRVYVHNNNILL